MVYHVDQITNPNIGLPNIQSLGFPIPNFCLVLFLSFGDSQRFGLVVTSSHAPSPVGVLQRLHAWPEAGSPSYPSCSGIWGIWELKIP